MERGKPKRKKFERYPIGHFHIDLAEVRTADGKLYGICHLCRQESAAPAVLLLILANENGYLWR